jgi:Kef-type K+ transport system membrane component KefB
MLGSALSNPLILLALILLLAALFGDATERLGVPWITGCILAGILLGPDATGVLTPSELAGFGGFLQASLALIAFNIGSRLTAAKLGALGSSISLLALLQLLAPPAAVLAALTLLGLPWPTSLIVAAVSPATAPTTTYAIVRRRNASGPFVDRALGILAVNDAATILLFSVASATVVSWLGASVSATDGWAISLQAAKGEALSIIGGAALGALYLLMRDVVADGRPGWEDRLRAALYGTLFLAVGVATAFELSHLLTPLVMGVLVANGVKKEEQAATQAVVGDMEQPLYMIFFVLAGAHLPLKDIVSHPAIVAVALAYVLARIVGKYSAVFLGATALRLDDATRKYLGLCFPSQGGASMGLVLACHGSPAVRALSPDAGRMIDTAVTIVLLGVFLSQMFGPLVIDYAIRRGSQAPARA